MRLLVLLLLSGCSMVPVTHEADRTVALLRVVWTEPEQMSVPCGQAKYSNQTVGGCYDILNQIIYTPKPRDWSDEERQRILGHEVMHLLGMRHE